MDRRHPIVNFDSKRFSDFFGDLTPNLDARLLSGGACNSNYVVHTSKRDRFVCRIHNRGNPLVEKTITELLGDDVPAPEYLWVGEGVSVISFLEGAHFSPTRELMREAGRIIGSLKSISFEQKGQILANGEVVPFEGWDSFEMGLLRLLNASHVLDYLDSNSIEALKRIIQRNRKLLDSFDCFHNLVHGDFRPDNILVSGDSITGILDWEFAHSGCSYMDIGNLLRHVPSEWEQDLSLGLLEAGFELPPDWRFRSLLIDLASHLEFLTSNRADNFKRECVSRIEALIKLGAEQDIVPNP